MSSKGKVFLVGAGPGDPGLITVKGLRCLEEAEVIIYDRLISPELLEHAAQGAIKVFMGKTPETPGDFQESINQTIVQFALDGKRIVRLKGGDPFVFGRGGEEIEALIQHEIPFEVVPGITSVNAVPAYSGVPLTHRGLSTSFTVVSGSEDPSKDETQLDWDSIAKVPGTLVVLMGWKTLPRIISSLIANGRDPSTPVSVTQWGTLPKQRTEFGTLDGIVEQARSAGITSPVVTVIGDVASLGSKFRWFETKPLFGKTILVTRSRQQASTLSALLKSNGAETIEIPTIQIAEPPSYDQLDTAIRDLSRYRWVIFTSTNSVDHFFGRLEYLGLDSRVLGTMRISAVGPSTEKSLNKHGIRADYVPDTYTSEAMAKGMKRFDMEGVNVLLPRSDIATETLSNGLVSLGSNVEEVVAYRTVTPADSAQRIRTLCQTATIDIATFTSSSTVTNLLGFLDSDISLLKETVIASIGPVTTKTLRQAGLDVEIEATEHTINGLAEAIIDYCNQGVGK